MKKSKILFVSQEIFPYLEKTDQSNIGRFLPQGVQEKGKEIRTFMPKFGCINERRNQLHEVIRLSGMNLIINETDHPLIIKVASIQSARMQVYFIDNEEYFQRKNTIRDGRSKFHKDNDERTIFYCRGVLETVKKLGWSPDLIYCQGWMTSLIPLYVKTAYKDDPMFKNSRVIYSVFDDEFKESFSDDYKQKVLMEGISASDVKELKDPTWEGITKNAISKSDAIINGSEKINSNIQSHITKIGRPTLEFQSSDDYIDAYSEFFDEVLMGDPVMV
ncbi:MAG: glycogen/starch synthase [Bacteroidia bacterium]|nr:glycogen/starch synthase [Bacteroidia bacterium]